MFKNYLTTALRNFWKNKLFALINIVGLAVGLLVFVFANLFANYEENHDAFFPNSERIHMVRSEANPAARLGVVSVNSVYTSMAPLMRQDIPEIEQIARLNWTDIIVNREDVKFYQAVHFVDPEFVDIFQFNYLHGTSAQALTDNNSVVLTESAAIKYYGRPNVLGETLTFNNELDLKVTAVIEDLPLDSHLSGNPFDDEHFEILATRRVYQTIFDLSDDRMNSWSGLSISNRTYLLLPEGIEPKSLEGQMNNILDRYGPENTKEIITEVGLRPLTEMNLGIWAAIGIPGILIMRFLGFIVLGIAAINFINLATAQAFGRAREIGIRKTMGASRKILAVQFLVESVVITFLALLVAIPIIEYFLPTFNSLTNKAVKFSYFSDPGILLFLILTVFGVGLLSGIFPAFLLSKLDASKALKGNMALGKWSIRFRKFLVISQNTFSVFLIIMVLVTYSMSSSIQDKDLGFNADNTTLLLRINRDGINENYETLKNEIKRIPGVINVTAASQYPYEQSHGQGKYGTVNNAATAVTLGTVSVDPDFHQTLEIPIIAGRTFSEEFSGDTWHGQTNENQGAINVIIGRKTVTTMGWSTPEEALGKTIYGFSGTFGAGGTANDGSQAYVVVGVAGDALLQGLHNDQKPFVYFNRPQSFWAMMIKFDPAVENQVNQDIEATWNRVLPNYPIIRSSLADAFDDAFSLFKGMNNAILGFTIMAFLIATIGLFALSAFMAERRIKEVGIRKTLGASTAKIVKLLTFQFSIPVIWAAILGSALAALVTYLLIQNFGGGTSNFFDLMFLVPVGGVVSLLLAWVTVGTNAYRAANTSPVNSLHYE